MRDQTVRVRNPAFLPLTQPPLSAGHAADAPRSTGPGHWLLAVPRSGGRAAPARLRAVARFDAAGALVAAVAARCGGRAVAERCCAVILALLHACVFVLTGDRQSLQ